VGPASAIHSGFSSGKTSGIGKWKTSSVACWDSRGHYKCWFDHYTSVTVIALSHPSHLGPGVSALQLPVFFLVSLGGVRLSPLGTSATVGLLYQPRMIDNDDYGAVGGMRDGRGNRSTRRKPAPVPLCPPQIPHDLGSNPGRLGGKTATNRLSYGTALASWLIKALPSSFLRLSQYHIVTCLVTIEGVWSGNCIYCTLTTRNYE
jgi:hypothetical protein